MRGFLFVVPTTAAAPQEVEMEKAIFSDTKGSNGKPMWILMPDGSIFINQKYLKEATIQRVTLTG